MSGEFGTLAFDEGNASVRKTVEKYPHSAPGTVLVSYNPITGTAVEATPPSGQSGAITPVPVANNVIVDRSGRGLSGEFKPSAAIRSRPFASELLFRSAHWEASPATAGQPDL